MLFELVFSLILLLLCILIKKWSTNKYPPGNGPISLPLVGSLIQTGMLGTSLPAIVFTQLATMYGDVFYLKIGLKDAVVFNSSDSISHIMTHKNCQNRAQKVHPVIMKRMFNQNLGLLFSNGMEWESLRRFTIRTLRDFGFGKTISMDSIITEEAKKLVVYLNEKVEIMDRDGFPNLTNLLGLSTVSTLWRFVTGMDYYLDDSKLMKLVKLNNAIVKSTNCAQDISIAFPFLYHWFPKLLKKDFHRKVLNELECFIRETVDDHWNKKDYKTSPNCFLDAFLAKMEAEEGNCDSVFTIKQLVICLMDLFQAGADTTSNTLSFAFLYMMIHPEIQEKVYQELDEKLGKDETITIQSKPKLPYTLATLLECARFASVTPIGITREAKEDFYYKGYLIKKNMLLILNLYSPRFEESIWGDPFKLRPERFLKADGSGIDMKMVAKINQFGTGPRMCPGANLAENVQFIYFATILKHFYVKKVNSDDVLSIEPQLGVSYSPRPYKVKFIRR